MATKGIAKSGLGVEKKHVTDMKYLFNTASQLFAEHLHAVPAALISYKRGKESRHGEL